MPARLFNFRASLRRIQKGTCNVPLWEYFRHGKNISITETETVTFDFWMCSLLMINFITNMKQLLGSFCLIILFAVVSGCSTPNSPASSGGSITGIVTLGSQIGTSSQKTFASSAGASISLDGTSLSTLTDSSGFWKIDNVPAANYDVTITKSGFGLTRIYGVAIGGPGTAYIPRVALGDLPSKAPELVSAKIVTVVWTDSGTVHQREDLQIRWKTSYDRSYSGLAIFMDKDASVQPGDVHFYSTVSGNALSYDWYGWYQTTAVADSLPHSNTNDGLISCPLATLHTKGISTGMKMYISLAQWNPYSINGDAPNTKTVYYDPIHNQNRLISPSPASNVVEVTIP